MTSLKQNLTTIGGSLLVSIVFLRSITDLYREITGSSGGGSVLGVMDLSVLDYIIIFFLAFPFIYTLIEFCFKKPFRTRVPYFFIMLFFVLMGIIMGMEYSLEVIGISFVAALPGSLYHWVRNSGAKRK